MVTLYMRGSRGGWGEGGPDPLENHESIGSPKQSQNYKASIQCRSIIGLPAKRHLNGVSLASHLWPAYSAIWILPPLITPPPPPAKKKKGWPPSDKSFWIRACFTKGNKKPIRRWSDNWVCAIKSLFFACNKVKCCNLVTRPIFGIIIFLLLKIGISCLTSNLMFCLNIGLWFNYCNYEFFHYPNFKSKKQM